MQIRREIANNTICNVRQPKTGFLLIKINLYSHNELKCTHRLTHMYFKHCSQTVALYFTLRLATCDGQNAS